MYSYLKKIPILAPALLFISFEIFFFWPSFRLLIALTGVSLIIGAGSLIFLARENIKNHWPTMIQIILLILGGSLFSLFISHPALYSLFLIMLSLLYWFILNMLFRLIYQPRLYRPYSFETASFWLVFVNIFFFAAELSALSVFYNIAVILTVLPFFVLCLWFNFYLFKINKIEFEQKITILIVFSLILTEFYFILNFLPINFHIIGLILAGFSVIIFKLWLKAQKLILPMIPRNQEK